MYSLIRITLLFVAVVSMLFLTSFFSSPARAYYSTEQCGQIAAVVKIFAGMREKYTEEATGAAFRSQAAEYEWPPDAIEYIGRWLYETYARNDLNAEDLQRAAALHCLLLVS